MIDLCERLAAWSAGRRWAGVSEAGQAMARRLLLDTIGCALGGRDHPAAVQAQAVARSLPGEAVSMGLGSGTRLSSLGAILDSGAAIRALDLNDFYWGPGLGGHPSDIFAVAIAVAEETGATVAEMLAAIVCGYEVYTRLTDLMRAGEPAWPWDHTTACAVSSAVICGRLYGLDAERMAEAIAIAAARAPTLSCLRAGRISSVKAAVPAMVQIDAFLAVRLAAAGMTGPREVIGGPRGLAAVVSPGSDLGHLVPPADERERVLDITIKRHPCMGTAQASTAAALVLHQRLGGRVSGLERLTVHVSDSGIVRRQVADVYRRPDRRETADHSFYALFAMALADGRLEPAQFASDRWKESDVVEIIDRMILVPDLPGAEEGIFAARAGAQLADGTEVVVDMPYAPGHRLNPLDDEGVADKFMGFAEPVLGRERAAGVVALCGRQGDDRAVSDLAAALSARR